MRFGFLGAVFGRLGSGSGASGGGAAAATPGYFGHSYFGARYFGPRFYGGLAGASVTSPAETSSPTPVTDLLGPMLGVTATRALGAEYDAWETEFVTSANLQWNANGPQWDAAAWQNYYDRAAIYYAQWYRNKDDDPVWAATCFTRAGAMATNYRDNYIIASGYGPTRYWSQMMGIALHALLENDALSLSAVGRICGNNLNDSNLAYYANRASTDARDTGRLIEMALAGWRCYAPTVPSGYANGAAYVPAAWATSTSYPLNATVTKDGSTYTCRTAHTSGTFATDLTAVKWQEIRAYYSGWINRFLNVFLANQGVTISGRTVHAGTWRYVVPDYYECFFMDGIFNEILRIVIELFPSGVPSAGGNAPALTNNPFSGQAYADISVATMFASIKNNVDFDWTLWDVANQCFRYLEHYTPLDGGPNDLAPDLNNMIGGAPSYVYYRTGTAGYKTKAEDCFAGCAIGDITAGSAAKQFNERYRYILTWPYYRQATPNPF